VREKVRRPGGHLNMEEGEKRNKRKSPSRSAGIPKKEVHELREGLESSPKCGTGHVPSAGPLEPLSTRVRESKKLPGRVPIVGAGDLRVKRTWSSKEKGRQGRSGQRKSRGGGEQATKPRIVAATERGRKRP